MPPSAAHRGSDFEARGTGAQVVRVPAHLHPGRPHRSGRCLLDRKPGVAGRRRRALCGGTGIRRGHHRRRNPLWADHGLPPGGGCPVHIGVRLPAPGRFLPQRTDRIPALGTRGGPVGGRDEGLLCRRHGVRPVHSLELPQLCGGLRQRRPARHLDQHRRRHRQRGQLLRRAWLAGGARRSAQGGRGRFAAGGCRGPARPRPQPDGWRITGVGRRGARPERG